MMRDVFRKALPKAVLLMATVLLLPVSALGQGTDSDQYQLRRLAGHGLLVRGYSAEAFFILEELGDHALAAGDTAGAIQAYHDAAWIAGDLAKRSERFTPMVLGIPPAQQARRTASEAERVLRKAMALGGSDSPQVAPLGIEREPGDRQVGLEIGRILSALEHPLLATLVYEILGDEALDRGDDEFATQAYLEGWSVAYDEYLKTALNYDVAIPSSKRDFVVMQEIAERLQKKADDTGV
jgi:hypothetical protein